MKKVDTHNMKMVGLKKASQFTDTDYSHGCTETNEELLDELFSLTQLEQDRKLTWEEEARYIELVDALHEREVEIPFPIEL